MYVYIYIYIYICVYTHTETKHNMFVRGAEKWHDVETVL